MIPIIITSVHSSSRNLSRLLIAAKSSIAIAGKARMLFHCAARSAILIKLHLHLLCHSDSNSIDIILQLELLLLILANQFLDIHCLLISSCDPLHEPLLEQIPLL